MKTASKKGAMARRKGVVGEREVRHLFEDAGFTARGLEAAGDHLMLRAEGQTYHVEVKRQERLEIMRWVRQAESEAEPGSVVLVAFRQNRGPWYVVMQLGDFLAEAKYR